MGRDYVLSGVLTGLDAGVDCVFCGVFTCSVAGVDCVFCGVIFLGSVSGVDCIYTFWCDFLGSVAGVDDTQEGDDDSGAGITERENGPDAEREGDG